MDGVSSPNVSSFGGAPSQDRAKVASVISSASSSRSRRSRLADLVLRTLAVVFSLIAFATMASDRKSATYNVPVGEYNFTGNLELKYSDFASMKAFLSANVLVCAYSLAQAFGALVTVVAGHGLLPTTLSEYLSFIFDQIFAYFVLATSGAGAAVVDLLNNGFDNLFPSISGLSSFYKLAAASVSFGFFTFVVVGVSAVQSGYYLAKHILRF